ncbi:MAG: MarR family transcriptional regulator [Fibrella sp.]|nr:MarR family transcriptional regulator [Armatimonadota bacterium]
MGKATTQATTFSELILEIFRLNRLLLDAGDEITEPVGLSSARWQVLGVVEHGPVPAANIARIMGLTRQAVQRTADSLEADGLIAFRPNPHHRRAQLLTLTPEGRVALDYVQERHAEWADRLSEGYAPDALTSALAVLRRMRDDLDPGGFAPEEDENNEAQPS